MKITALSSLSGNPKPYMHYGDNPQRPILSFWFGPMTMIDFLGNYNLWYTGYGNDASRYLLVAGHLPRIADVRLQAGDPGGPERHAEQPPQRLRLADHVQHALTSSSDTSADRFNRVRVGLRQNYTILTDSLWYPPATVGNPAATVTPYDANNLEVPRAMGGTCYAMGLMLAYNQFSSNSALLNYNTAT